MSDHMTPEDWARRFHDTYERLAPSYGYETREDTKAFELESPNGLLMVAVCGEVVRAAEAAALRRAAEHLTTMPVGDVTYRYECGRQDGLRQAGDWLRAEADRAERGEA